MPHQLRGRADAINYVRGSDEIATARCSASLFRFASSIRTTSRVRSAAYFVWSVSVVAIRGACLAGLLRRDDSQV